MDIERQRVGDSQHQGHAPAMQGGVARPWEAPGGDTRTVNGTATNASPEGDIGCTELKKIRTEFGVSQADFGAMVGLSRNVISAAERYKGLSGDRAGAVRRMSRRHGIGPNGVPVEPETIEPGPAKPKDPEDEDAMIAYWQYRDQVRRVRRARMLATQGRWDEVLTGLERLTERLTAVQKTLQDGLDELCELITPFAALSLEGRIADEAEQEWELTGRQPAAPATPGAQAKTSRRGNGHPPEVILDDDADAWGFLPPAVPADEEPDDAHPGV